jgi:hypothetical protein
MLVPAILVLAAVSCSYDGGGIPATTCEDGVTCPDATPGCSTSADCTSPEAAVCNEVSKACEGCQSDEACAEFPLAARCDVGSGHCVECRMDLECAEPGSPVCDGGTCRQCQLDAECVSGVCDEAAGTCRPEAAILYVAPGGADQSNTACSRLAPCKTLRHALGLARAAPRPDLIRVAPGSYMENGGSRAQALVIEGGRPTTIVATGASLTRPAADGAHVLEVRGASTNVAIEGLRIHGGSSSASGHGMVCTTGATVTLRGARFEGNDGIGLQSVGCTLTIEGTVFGGKEPAAANRGGALSATAGTIAVRNSVFLGNGTDGVGGSPFGGVILSNPTGASIFEFNTVAANLARTSSAGGVRCESPDNTRIEHNIIHANSPTEAALQSQVNLVGCDTGFNLSEEDLGSTNIAATPMFAADGFHLQASSRGVDEADARATLATDIDGEPRPHPSSGRRDIGADELRR